jgi:FKBP-type peptidyl-prolyl cis-trans isomerase
MTKLLPYLLLIGLLSLTSCKQEPTRATTTPVPITSKSLSVNDLYADYYQDPSTPAQREQNAIIDYIAEQNIEVLRSPSGLYYQVTKGGSGPTFERGDYLKVHYRGYFLNGQEFDSSYSRGRPMGFKVGQMITGFNEVCYYLRPGAAATVIIPSRLGYGVEGMQDIVPPNSTLVFDIEVVEPK